MMMRCHHLDLIIFASKKLITGTFEQGCQFSIMMHCRQVDIPYLEPSLVDEVSWQNSLNRTGCVIERSFLGTF